MDHPPEPTADAAEVETAAASQPRARHLRVGAVSLPPGRIQEAATRLEALVEPARALDQPAVWVELLMARAWIAHDQDDFATAERDLTEAHRLASAAGLPLHVVRAAQRLIRLMGLEQGRHREAMALAEDTLALVRREPSAADYEANLVQEMAVVLHEQGKYAEAAELQRRVLELRERQGDPLELATALETLGSLLDRLGRSVEALEHGGRSRSVSESSGQSTSRWPSCSTTWPRRC